MTKWIWIALLALLLVASVAGAQSNCWRYITPEGRLVTCCVYSGGLVMCV